MSHVPMPSPCPAHRRRSLAAAFQGFCLGLLFAASAAASAAEPVAGAARKSYVIAPGSLELALGRFAAAAGIPLSFDPGLVAGKQSPGLNGVYSGEEGLRRLLEGSGLGLEAKSGGGYTLSKLPEAERAEAVLPAVTVKAAVEAASGGLPAPYAGGQVASGGGLGMLGARGFMETPFNLTAYTAKLIEDQQARTVADVVANDASVRNAYARGNYRDEFIIRGFPAYNYDIAFDGLYGLMPYDATAVEYAERVEVLKGPSALLNGNVVTAIGGNVNIVPKRAQDAPLTRFTATYGSDALIGGHLDLGRRFGEDKAWGIRFNGAYRNGETAIEDNANRFSVAALAVDYRSDTLRMSLDVGHQTAKVKAFQDTVDLDAAVQVPRPPDAARNLSQPWQRSKDADDFVAVRGELALGDRLSAYAAAGSSRSRQDYLFGGSYVTDDLGNTTVWPYYFPAYSRTRTLQAGLMGNVRSGPVDHRLVFGTAVLRSEAGYLFTGLGEIQSNLYDRIMAPEMSIAGLSDRPPKSSEARVSSIALADTLSMLDGRLQLTLGLRRQRVKSDDLDQVTGDTLSSYDEQATTPAIALLVKLNPEWSLYGNYIEALTQGPTAPSTASNAGQVFPPYTSKQYELGVKADLGSVGGSISLFQISRPSGIIDPLTKVYALDGEQRNRGLEVSVFGEPTRGVRLLSSAMFLQARLVRTEDGTNDGHGAVAAPRTTLNLGAEFDVPAVPGLILTGRVLHTGSQYQNVENSRSIPAWHRVDLGARYGTSAFGYAVVLRAAVENLTNRNYWASTNAGQLLLGSPRTLLLSAAFDF